MNKLIIGTRGSRLALWQSNYIKELLNKEYADLHVILKIIKTKGDLIQDKALPDIGGKGLFTQEIDTALLNESIDLAVHSLKDLPSDLPLGLEFACTPEREDVRDAFVSLKWKNISDLPAGAVIATGSVRRKAQIRSVRRDIEITGLRGNIDTRLKKLENNDWDGIIMAAAALNRLGLKSKISEKLNADIYIPSVGQGALGLEIKSSRLNVKKILKNINHAPTMLAVQAERRFMKVLGGGCSVPLGAWGREKNGKFYFSGFFAAPHVPDPLIKIVYGRPESGLDLADSMAKEFKKQIS